MGAEKRRDNGAKGYFTAEMARLEEQQDRPPVTIDANGVPTEVVIQFGRFSCSKSSASYSDKNLYHTSEISTMIRLSKIARNLVLETLIRITNY